MAGIFPSTGGLDALFSDPAQVAGLLAGLGDPARSQ
jgi:hypothetical protein